MLDDLADSDDDEGIALLPLTASGVQAMDNPLFLQLLDILSIDKPTDQVWSNSFLNTVEPQHLKLFGISIFQILFSLFNTQCLKWLIYNLTKTN